MSKRIAYWRVSLAIAAGLLLAGSLATAQETPKPPSPPSEAQTKLASVYRLDFVVRELEAGQHGKLINSRNYSLSAKSHEWAGLRVGSKVPYATAAAVSAATGAGQGFAGIQYQDVGINIDARYDERDSEVLLTARFESSSVVTPERSTEEGRPPNVSAPVFRQVRFNGDALVAPGRPTVIGMLDDVGTNHRFEIEVTVTKMK